MQLKNRNKLFSNERYQILQLLPDLLATSTQLDNGPLIQQTIGECYGVLESSGLEVDLLIEVVEVFLLLVLFVLQVFEDFQFRLFEDLCIGFECVFDFCLATFVSRSQVA